MNTNELMIGNLCQDKISGALLKVTGTHENDISFYVIDRNLFPLQPGWQAEPIPLTEEWLLRFGFEKNDNNQFILMEGSVDILFNKDLNGWTCDGINFSINMTEHVHQLQNLYFALTGEELKLKEDESKTD
jgi:hypothetical protein